MRAVRQKAVGLTFGKRRIGKQGRGDRLQGQADAEFLHHVGFTGKVEIDLDRAGARHHVQAQIPALGHVIAHDPVATLGHPGHILAPPLGLETDTKKAQAQRFGHGLDFLQVDLGFTAGLVDILQGRAGQFQLSCRLQRNRGTIAAQADQHAVFFDRIPAKALQALQQGADAALTFVRWCPPIRCRWMIGIAPLKTEFLVLGADAPLRLRLAACS